jgi:hypothetical protein
MREGNGVALIGALCVFVNKLHWSARIFLQMVFDDLFCQSYRTCLASRSPNVHLFREKNES